MPLETANYISDLVTSNPAHSDGLNAADAHMRLIKSVLKNTFPGLTGPLMSASGLILPFDGTASAPGLAFASENTLGFYRLGAGRIGIAGSLVGSGAKYIGEIFDFAGTTAPTGCMACDGQALSKTTYPDLFAAIGYTWGGSGDTFNLPNLMDRFRRHRSTASANFGGAVGNTQAPCNLTHTHPVTGSTGAEDTAHTHNFSGVTGAMNQNQTHAHGFTAIINGNSAPGSGVGGGGNFGTPQGSTTGPANTDHNHNFSGTTAGENQAHAHAVNLTSQAGSADGNEARPYSATVLTCIRVT